MYFHFLSVLPEIKPFHKSAPSRFGCPVPDIFRYFSARFFRIKVSTVCLPPQWFYPAVLYSRYFHYAYLCMSCIGNMPGSIILSSFFTVLVPSRGIGHIFPLHPDVMAGHDLSPTVFRRPEHRQPVSMSVYQQYAYGQQYCRDHTVNFSFHIFLPFSSGHGLLLMAAACYNEKI